MARFDVYLGRNPSSLLLDCQADLLGMLDTRFVVPLLVPTGVRPAFARLNPVFTMEGRQWVMVTQSAAAVPASMLGDRLTSLAEEQSAIMNALDMLLTGY